MRKIRFRRFSSGDYYMFALEERRSVQYLYVLDKSEPGTGRASFKLQFEVPVDS